MPVAFLLVIAGIALVATSLHGAHRLSGSLALLAACGFPVGVVLTLAGTLLCYLPDFFRT